MPIDVTNLTYIYFKKTPFQADALKGVNFHIDDNDFVAFIGATGSGKSTIIQHLNGLLTPSDGTVKVDEFLLTNNKKKNKNIGKLRKHVGVVFQFPEYQLFEETVEEDVAFGPKNFNVSKEEALIKAHKALLDVGLNESYFLRSPFELSGGEKRRVAIAGILALEPDILVLDEPTAGLDNEGRDVIMSLFEKIHHEQHKTIILVSHDMDLVNKYAKKVFVVDDGKIVAYGKPKDIFLSYLGHGDLEIPQIYAFCRLLKEKGIDLDVNKIENIDDLIDQIDERIQIKNG